MPVENRPPTSPVSPWLTRRQLADRLGLAPKTLANWATAGKGPKFNKRLHRYHIAHVEKWEQAIADE